MIDETRCGKHGVLVGRWRGKEAVRVDHCRPKKKFNATYFWAPAKQPFPKLDVLMLLKIQRPENRIPVKC
jgi:hypothetical protein